MHDTRIEAEDQGRGSHRGLVALNLILLLILAAVTFAPTAGAQQRSRGNYNMVGGGTQGSNTGVVWVLDGANQELIAVAYDRNAKQLKGVGYRNVARDGSNLSAKRN
jgi:hypothetical protein